MPYIVTGDVTQRPDIYTRDNYDYEYPNGLDLKPGSDFHNEIRNKIWQRARESRNEMSKRFKSWNEIDRVLTTYIPTSDKERMIKKQDSRKPISIVFPYT